MSENIDKSIGRPKAYTPGAGDVPIDLGLYVGKVKNNVDTARTGQLDVYISYLGGSEDDANAWIKVSYVSPFYGATNLADGDIRGSGTFTGNPHSYGMWFTPPDINTEVICFFAQGDPNQGYYLGSVVNPTAHHMVPAIGSTPDWAGSENRSGYFANSFQLPVVEINDDVDEADNPRFFENTKPVHSRVAYVLLQQGLVNDQIRGTVTSNSYRESPSSVYGISTPGRPIFQGGITDVDVEEQINDRSAVYGDFNIIGRRGGHSFVMDDGSLGGQDQMIRLRTSQGHQIMMSDDGQFLHIIHANGQSWIELGKEGTLDVYSSNSINLRTQGDLNLHADRDVNINAGRRLNINADTSINAESPSINLSATENVTLYSKQLIGVKADGTLSLKSKKNTTIGSGEANVIVSSNKPEGKILLNSETAPDVTIPTKIIRAELPDVFWVEDQGWVTQDASLQTIVPRAPAHEPWPLHNAGVNSVTNPIQTAPPPLPATSGAKAEQVKTETPVSQPVSTEDVQTQAPAAKNVGSITPEQVTGMLAQANKAIAQGSAVLSNELGAGKFGLSPEQLQAVGVLKPGVVENFLTDSGNTINLLQNASNFTGKAGITNIDGFLNDPNIQDFIKTELYADGLQKLQSTGLATGLEDSALLSGLVEAASKVDAATLESWVNGNLGNIAQGIDLDSIARGAQFGVDLVKDKLSEIDADGIISGLQDTFERSSLNDAVNSVINNDKVPVPEYTTKDTPPVQNRRVQSNGSLTDFNIQTSDPWVQTTIDGQPTRIYGPENLLRRYYSSLILGGFSSLSLGSS